MPKTHNRGRTRRSGLLIVGISVLVLLGAAATFVAVRGWSAISNIFASEKKDPHEGKVGVITAQGPIPAFTALDPAIFVDPKTGSFHMAWITEKVATDANLIRDPAKLRGRVLKRDKGPGLAFSEADFYPPGTAAGATAAIEPGYRGVSLSTKDVDGLVGRTRFERVDLIAVINIHSDNAGKDGVVYTPEAAAASKSANEWKTERRVVAQNAKILVPAPQAKSNMGTAECFVAIREEEASAVADAIAKGAKIVCMARSGLPGGDSSQFVDQDDAPAVDRIRVTSGNKTWDTYVPADAPPPEPKK